mgnify:FL=1
MIYTVTLNPSLDYTMKLADFNLGGINRSLSENIAIGGKGINISKALHKLHIRSTVCGFYAGIIGKTIFSEASHLKLKSIWVNVKGCSRINVKLETKPETAINGLGSFATLEDVDRLCNLIETNDNSFVVLSGSVCNGLPSSTYAYMMSKLKGRFFVDATKDLLTNTLAYKPFLIKPNHEELGEIFGCEIDSFEKAVIYGRKLCEQGAQNVIVSMGSKGSVFVNQQEEYIRKGSLIDVNNTVGAGDTMLAGFIYGIIKKFNFKECLNFASEQSEKMLLERL